MSVLHPDNPTTSFGHPRFPVHIDWLNHSANALQLDSPTESDPSTNSTLSFLSRNDYGDDFGDLATNTTWTEEGPSSLEPFIGGPAHRQIRQFCKQILVEHIAETSIRYWDALILVPNLIFMLFLILKLGRMRQKLRHSKSPVFCAFFALVYLTTILNVVRCLTSMSISITSSAGEVLDKALWLALKFFLLLAELSVLSFGLLFGHLDSASSIQRALLATVIFCVIHSGLQAVLEFNIWDDHFIVESLRVYAHGGTGFWLFSSGFFAVVYTIACLLPLTCFRSCSSLPRRFAYYMYCTCLAIVNIVQTAAAAMILLGYADGMCVADLTTFVYFTFYTPLVYFVFLRRSLSDKNANGSGPLFSYHQHKDEAFEGLESSSYYPRFSGLTSPSYDDLFDYDRLVRQRNTPLDNILGLDNEFYYPRDLRDPFSSHNVPLMMATPDSTYNRMTDISEGDTVITTDGRGTASSSAGSCAASCGMKQLRGLGADGSLYFSSGSPDILRMTSPRS
jgi:hypothetical protein